MTTAKIENKERVIVTETKVKEEVVTLEMDKETARTLLDVLNSVGGYPGDNTPRGRMDKLGDVLKNVGIFPCETRCTGSLFYK